MTSPEQRLMKDITKRIQQAFLNRATELEIGEAVHQNIAAANVKLIELHQRRFEQIAALKELISLMVSDWEDEQDLIYHYQAAEGHAYEVFTDSQKVYHDWANVQTVLDNLEAVYQARIDALEAQNDG